MNETWFTEGPKLSPTPGTTMAITPAITAEDVYMVMCHCTGPQSNGYLIRKLNGTTVLKQELLGHGPFGVGGYPTWGQMTIAVGEHLDIISVGAMPMGNYSASLHVTHFGGAPI